MTDNVSTAAATAATTASSAVSSVTTRSQQQKNDEKVAADDDSTQPTPENNRKKERETFKGKSDKLAGHVFQLAVEGRKANQFSETLKAFHDYANVELDNPQDLAPWFNDPCTDVTLEEPPDEPPFGADKKTRVGRDHRKYIQWKSQCEQFNQKEKDLAANKVKIFTILMQQCSPSVTNKVEASTGFERAKKNYNCKWLITTIKNVCHNFEQTENRFVALINAKAAIFAYRQGANQSTHDYHDTFKELVSVLESYGGKLQDPIAAVPTALAKATADGLTSDLAKDKLMREHYTAALFIRNADSARYGTLREELSIAFSLGRDEYPVSLTEAYQLLLTRKGPTTQPSDRPSRSTSRGSGRGGGRDGRGSGRGRLGGRGAGPPAGPPGTPPGTVLTGKTLVQVTASPTTNKPPVRFLFTQHNAIFNSATGLAQSHDHFPNGIPSHFVLLDSDSSISIFNNISMLDDVHDVDTPLVLQSNGGGHQVTKQMGSIPQFGKVWYNPDSIANILSLADVRKARRVTMDSSADAAFHVHVLDGSGYLRFKEHESGLYLHDTTEGKINYDSATTNDNNEVIGYSYLQTVADNKKGFTKRQIDAADLARLLYRKLGRPGAARFLEIIQKNLIINCPLTVDDIARAERIYGKDVAFLKGKTTASPANDHVPQQPPICLPPTMLSDHGKVTLCCDIFYVLGLPFSLSVSRNIHFLSCRPMPNRDKPSIRTCISSDIATYHERGFEVTNVHCDGEYNHIKPLFPNVRFDICAPEDHVPEIERAIRTVKDTIRSTIHGMPYHRLPRTLVKELASMAVRTYNSFPHPDGISDTLSPASIVTGSPKPDYKTFPLEFGSYVQVYDGTSNDTKSRTLGAIATNPTGNSSGDHYFMSLETGKRIHRRSWTVLPITDATISRVEILAEQEGMPAVDHDISINEYDPDEVIDESAYDHTYQPPLADPPHDHHLTTDAYTSESDLDDDDFDDNGHSDEFDSVPIPPPSPEERTVPHDENEERVEAKALETEERKSDENAKNEERNDPTSLGEERNDPTPAIAIEPEAVEKEERENEEREAATKKTSLQSALRSKREGLRNKAGRADYKYRFGFTQITQSIAATTAAFGTPPTHDKLSTLPAVQKAIYGLLFTQMTAQKGIKLHGQTAIDALRKEFEQFRAMDVLEPLDAFQLTDEQKSESLRALSVIKEKRDGRLKGRTVADGSAQRGKFSKSETGSPTAASDAVLLTAMIDAYENRDVAVADVTGAYLHAFMKDFISMRFTGWAVDLLCDVNPEYLPFVVHEGKTKALYVRCNKAIYGCVVSGMLWYELFSQTLEKHGFTINPYDFCVANATIDGTQCTIVWYVDDTKISHAKPSVVTNVIAMLESHFGKMSVSRGAKHEFLGMHLDFLGDGTATVHMPSYLESAIQESGLPITKPAPTPAAASLLHIEAASPLLPLDRARSFHSVVAKLIYVGTRARTDILLALGFLCSRVSAPTEQDERKLFRLLAYLSGTIDLKFRLGADSLDSFVTWVDASFAVHGDMRSHTGGVISFGRGGLICKSKKQSINTKSSTEAELIGASDYLPNTLFVKMFMAAQGYPISKAVFYQDNESAIKMESNGKSSCGQRSRHIDIRYFFITDHAKRQSVTIEHCPTGIMLADYFTKPLQGSLFRMFRSVLLGELPTSALSEQIPPAGNEERVDNGNHEPEHPGQSRYRDTKIAVAATATTDASHSFETYPVNE